MSEQQVVPGILPAPRCSFECDRCDIGAHEYCRNRRRCQCGHPTWQDITNHSSRDAAI